MPVFWDAIREHLVVNGFESIFGDHCLFRKLLLDGRVILTCTYIDDATYSVSDPSLADGFLAMLRSRFVFELELELRNTIPYGTEANAAG